MCYNVSYLEKRADRVAKHYGAHFKPEVKELTLFHASGFTHPQLPVITSEEPQWINSFNWGLIPDWCRDATQAKEISNKTLNAKSETIFEKPSFKNSIQSKRCIVIVSGFFEWQTFGKKKYPYYIRLKNRNFFSLGGVYNNWIDKSTGEILNTFSIITVEANSLMAKIHNSMKRMPLIIPENHEKDWVNNQLNKDEITAMMKSYNSDEMESYTISKLITDHHQNSNVPEVLNPFEYPELMLMNLD